MTPMPAALALSIAGWISLVSWARTMRTLAPWPIMLSMSVSCCSILRLASARMYFPPASSMAFFMAGSSAFAQRGCW